MEEKQEKETDINELLTVTEVASLLKISKRTVWRLVSANDLPPPVRFGGNVRWQKKVIINWMENGCPKKPR